MIQLSYEAATAVLFISTFFGACVTVLARFIERMLLPRDDRHEYTKALVVVRDAAVNLMADIGEPERGQQVVSTEDAMTLQVSINQLMDFEDAHSISYQYI